MLDYFKCDEFVLGKDYCLRDPILSFLCLIKCYVFSRSLPSYLSYGLSFMEFTLEEEYFYELYFSEIYYSLFSYKSSKSLMLSLLLSCLILSSNRLSTNIYCSILNKLRSGSTERDQVLLVRSLVSYVYNISFSELSLFLDGYLIFLIYQILIRPKTKVLSCERIIIMSITLLTMWLYI